MYSTRGSKSDFMPRQSFSQKVTFANARDPGPAHQHRSPFSEYSKQLGPRQNFGRSTSTQELDTVSPPVRSSWTSSRTPAYSTSQDARKDGSENGLPVVNLTGGFLYSSPSSQSQPHLAPHTSTGGYDPLRCTDDELQRSATMTSMYNPTLRALDQPMATDSLPRQFEDDRTLGSSRMVDGKSFPKGDTDFGMVDAAIGHSNALELREAIRVDLQQLDLLVSDISHFRSKHAGVEIQRIKQRANTIQQWRSAFQLWFTDRAKTIMNNAEVIRRDQETLSKEVREQFLASQESVEGLEKQVSDISKKLQEETAQYQVKLSSTNQRKERLERQIRSLEAKRDTETALFHRNVANGESDIEGMEQIVARLEREVASKELAAKAQDHEYLERYQMLVADGEKYRQELSNDISYGKWQARFVDLVEESINKESESNPQRTVKREKAWDEIENLEYDLRTLDGSDDPLHSALMKICEAEVGTAKTNMTRLRKVYDQMMVVRNLNSGVNATLTSLALRHPVLFQKTPHELQDHFESLAASNTIQQIAMRHTLPGNDPIICAVSARNTQEKSRFRQKLDAKNLADRKRFEEGDISFLSNSKKRFEREQFIDAIESDIVDIHPGGASRKGSSKAAGIPRADPKQTGDITGEKHWATFGEAWID